MSYFADLARAVVDVAPKAAALVGVLGILFAGPKLQDAIERRPRDARARRMFAGNRRP